MAKQAASMAGCSELFRKYMNMKMPVDFRKKQRLGPTNLMEFGNGGRQDLDVVGRESRLRIFPGIPGTDATWRIRMRARCVGAGALNVRTGRQLDGMAHWAPVISLELGGLLGTPNDQGARVFERIPEGEVRVSAVERLNTRVGQDLIENTDVVSGTDGRINIDRNAAGAVEKARDLVIPIAEMGRRSSKHREPRITGGECQRIGWRVRRLSERFAAVGLANLGRERLRRPAKDMPAASLISMRQEGSRHAVPQFRITNLQVSRARQGVDVAQTRVSAELWEGRAERLVLAEEGRHFAIATVAAGAGEQLRRRKKICPLGQTSISHCSSTARLATSRQLQRRCDVGPLAWKPWFGSAV
jgi:hypothetical protein